jgi:multidrug efflux pump subunit AcrA (membrane-fusion protein)
MAAKEVQVQAASGAAADKDRQLQAANAAAAEQDAELHATKLLSAQQDDKLTQLMRRLEESERSHEATQAKLQQSYEVGAAWKLSWFFACCPDLGLGHQPGIMHSAFLVYGWPLSVPVLWAWRALCRSCSFQGLRLTALHGAVAFSRSPTLQAARLAEAQRDELLRQLQDEANKYTLEIAALQQHTEDKQVG